MNKNKFVGVKIGAIFGVNNECKNEKTMRIRKNVLDLLKSSGITRMKIAIALGVSESTVRRYVQENSSDLTKAAAVQVIKDMTGIQDEKKILEPIPAEKIK